MKLLIQLKLQLDFLQIKITDHRGVPGDKQKISHYQDLGEKLNNILQEKGLSDSAKFKLFNNYIYQKLATRPKDIYIPIFVPTNNEPFQPHPELKDEAQRTSVPETSILHAPEVKDALQKRIATMDNDTKDKVYQETLGTLGIQKDREVD
jgi:hypothetical protein